MKKYILAVFLPVAVLLTACEGFLENPPRHNWELENALTTYDKAKQAVNGIYPKFTLGDEFNQQLAVKYAHRTGFFNDGEERDYDMMWKQTDATVNGLWEKCYHAINACNMAINGIPGIPDAAFPDTNEKNQLLGEARFLRGYIYSVLMLNYCYWWESDMNSVYGLIYRDMVSEVSNIYSARLTVGESWEKIMDDIDFGITNMSPEFTTNRRVSVYFAKAYKARLFLIRGTMHGNQSDITEAKALVDALLSNIPAGIEMEADMRQLYENSWDSKENIFVRYMDEVNQTYYVDIGPWSEYYLSYMLKTPAIRDGRDVLQSEAVCGLQYGLDWMRSDPRWYVATGYARNAETWDNSYSWVWKKIYREGRYAGRNIYNDMKWACYYMRLPELYIMQAELRMRTGSSLADAIQPINQMRAQRTYPVLEQIAVPASEADFWDILLQEYAKEMILENGSEYFASLRIMKNGKTYLEEIKGPDFRFDKKRLQMAIPNSEIVNNPLAFQNPEQS